MASNIFCLIPNYLIGNLKIITRKYWSCPNEYINKILKKLDFVTLDELAPAVTPLLCSPIDYHKTDYSFMFWSRNKELSDQSPSFDKWYIIKGDGDADRPNLIN